MRLNHHKDMRDSATSSPQRSAASSPRTAASAPASNLPSRHPKGCKCETCRPGIYVNPTVKTQVKLYLDNGPFWDPCVKSCRCFLCHEDRNAGRDPLRHVKGCKCRNCQPDLYLPGVPSMYTAKAEAEVFSRRCVKFCRCKSCCGSRSQGRDPTHCSESCICLTCKEERQRHR
jgi:hypothetical protein